MEQEEIDTTELTVRKFKETCCKSYLTPKGRCFTCPEQDFSDDNELPDPDAEKY